MSGNEERTFIAIKPDGVQRGLVGEIIKRFGLAKKGVVIKGIVRQKRKFCNLLKVFQNCMYSLFC